MPGRNSNVVEHTSARACVHQLPDRTVISEYFLPGGDTVYRIPPSLAAVAEESGATDGIANERNE